MHHKLGDDRRMGNASALHGERQFAYVIYSADEQLFTLRWFCTALYVRYMSAAHTHTDTPAWSASI